MAAWARQALGLEGMAFRPVLVQLSEQPEHGARRQGQALLTIEPDQPTAVAEIQGHRAPIVGVEDLGAHRLIAAGAVQRRDASCFLAAATTASTEKPNFFCSSLSGAEAPNVVMPIASPLMPT